MNKINIGITGSTGSLGKELLKFRREFNFISYKDDIRSKKKLKKWLTFIAVGSIIFVVELNVNLFRSAKC